MTPSDRHALIVHLYEVKKLRVHQIAHLLCFSYRAVHRVIAQANAHRTATCSPFPSDPAVSGEGAEMKAASASSHKERGSR